jgi:hypothetical protein
MCSRRLGVCGSLEVLLVGVARPVEQKGEEAWWTYITSWLVRRLDETRPHTTLKWPLLPCVHGEGG